MSNDYNSTVDYSYGFDVYLSTFIIMIGIHVHVYVLYTKLRVLYNFLQLG